MPVSTSYPGIYIQELPSQSHTITPAPTSITVFVGYTHPFKTTVPWGTPALIFSFTDYERLFGGLYATPSVDGNVAYAVHQFFLNGGSQAYVVPLQPQVLRPETPYTTLPAHEVFFPATSRLPVGGNMTFTALEPADTANPITVTFSNQNTAATSVTTPAAVVGYSVADITITYGSKTEVFRGVSTDFANSGTKANYIANALANSKIVSLSQTAAPAIAQYPYGVFPPYSGTTPPLLPPPPPQSYTLSYQPAIATIPNTQVTFVAKVPVTTAAPLTVTFTTQVTFDATAGGYDTADITITSGTATPEHFSAVTSTNIVSVLNNATTGSALVSVTTAPLPYVTTGAFPPVSPVPTVQIPASTQKLSLLTPQLAPYFSSADFIDVLQASTPLDKVSVFNIMAIPGITDIGVLSAAVAFCEGKRAFLIMDPPPKDLSTHSLSAPWPDVTGVDTLVVAVTQAAPNVLSLIPQSVNAALYFPYLASPDPVTGQTINLPPSGTVAGIYARTDQNRGVWKAPAGLETTINNISGVVPGGVMTDMQAGVLNQNAVNAIRTFAGAGTVVFGARTVAATNPSFQQWTYVPVRRMALFIEQTLYANLGWVVFEPNDVPLWNAVKSTIERFMLSLFRQGAFQGTSPSQAFLVKCDSSTTTQDDIDNGKVNVLVGFAPLKPAEFVIIQITQLAGQASS
jgi:phage tail sheath protein FI